MNIDLGIVDLSLLKKQKNILFKMIYPNAERLTRKEEEAIEGVLGLLDHIQDNLEINLAVLKAMKRRK